MEKVLTGGTTQSQAETLAQDLRRMGHKARVRQLASGEWKVYFTEKGLTPAMKEEEVEIASGIRERRISRRIEELTEPTEEEEVAEETKKAARRLTVKRALESTPEEVAKATLREKQEQLKMLVEERRRKGHADPGIVVPVYHPVTKQIYDYTIDVRGIRQRIGEALERGARVRGRKIIEDIGKLPTTGSQFVEGVLQQAARQHEARQMEKGRRMQGSIGQSLTPRAVIAALPQRDIGAIGTTRPAIASGSIQPETAVRPSLNPKERGFAGSNDSMLRASPVTERSLVEKPSIQKGSMDSGKQSYLSKMPIIRPPVKR